EPIQIRIVLSFFGFPQAVINLLLVRDSIRAAEELRALFCQRDDTKRLSARDFQSLLAQQRLLCELPNIPFHPGTVTGVAVFDEIVRRYNAEPAYFRKRADFGFAE